MNCLRAQLASIAARSRPVARRDAYLPIRNAAWMARHDGLRVFFGNSAATPGVRSRDLSRRSRLEAVLFLAREPLALRRLAQLANLTDGTEARTLLAGLRKRYDERGCAFQIAQIGGGYQLLSRPEFAGWLWPQAGREQSVRLSPPALETLAVVAYRQPAMRAEVEAIRGVSCGEILRQLLERDLLRIVGRSEELGRPLWYGTTKRFLQVFGLCNLDELPWAAQLRRPAGHPDRLSPNNSAVSGAGLTGDVEAA
jgi:segregation and condensation protein B